jgi:hypothetical protein
MGVSGARKRPSHDPSGNVHESRRLSVMGRRNRDRLFGGSILDSEMKSAKREAAEKIRELQCYRRLRCKAWNFRMICQGGPVHPSPTIAEVISGG